MSVKKPPKGGSNAARKRAEPATTRAPRPPILKNSDAGDLLAGGAWTDRQRLFASAYLRHGIQSRAAIEAGYTMPLEHASQFGRHLLKVPHIRAYVNERIGEICTRYEVTAERVIGELASIAFSNPSDYFTFKDGKTELALESLTERQYKAIASIEVQERTTEGRDGPETIKTTTVKLGDKLKASEALGRHLRLFTDKIEVSGSIDLAERIKAARDRVRLARAEGGGDE